MLVYTHLNMENALVSVHSKYDQVKCNNTKSKAVWIHIL
jgi:hypothetical protein